jgi:hypothetical protein
VKVEKTSSETRLQIEEASKACGTIEGLKAIFWSKLYFCCKSLVSFHAPENSQQQT